MKKIREVMSTLSVLRIENLSVKVSGKRVLDGVDLEIPKGEIHVLFGPNGSGKTSLIMSVLGFRNYNVVSGRIFLNGVNVTDKPINERVRLGIGVAFQNPPAIRGVKLGDVVRSFIDQRVTNESELSKMVNFSPEFLKRDLNLGLSGGEIKRSEILQVLAQKPELLILDEPDSGVDVENLEMIGKLLNSFLKGRSGLFITHMGYILRYLETDKAHVMLNGTIRCSGKPIEIFDHILREGYWWCEECPLIRRKR
jgi:Fe-S cluster assembly ATP-binding protein